MDDILGDREWMLEDPTGAMKSYIESWYIADLDSEKIGFDKATQYGYWSACTACPYKGEQHELFGESASGKCPYSRCFHAKTNIAKDERSRAENAASNAADDHPDFIADIADKESAKDLRAKQEMEQRIRDAVANARLEFYESQLKKHSLMDLMRILARDMESIIWIDEDDDVK
jgi:hypothetical protein